MKSIRDELKQFNSIIKEIDSLYSEIARCSGLSDSSFWVLYYLTYMEKEITQKAICEQWFLSKQTVNNAIVDLQKKGYITLLKSETDRRNKQIFLTNLGEEFTKTHIKKVFNMEKSIFSQMDQDEIYNLMSINKKYLQLLRQELHQ